MFTLWNTKLMNVVLYFSGEGGEEEEFKCVQVFGYVKLDLLFLSNASKVAKG